MKDSSQEVIVSFFDSPTESSFIELTKKIPNECFLHILEGLHKNDACRILYLIDKYEYRLDNILTKNSKEIYNIIIDDMQERNQTLYKSLNNVTLNLDNICDVKPYSTTLDEIIGDLGGIFK